MTPELKVAIAIAVLATLTQLAIALLNFRKSSRNEAKIDILTLNVDGKLTQFMEMAKALYFAEGVKSEEDKAKVIAHALLAAEQKLRPEAATQVEVVNKATDPVPTIPVGTKKP